MLNKIWEFDYYRNDLKMDFTINKDYDYITEVTKIYILYLRYTNFNKNNCYQREVGRNQNLAEFFDEEKLCYLHNVYNNTEGGYNQFVSYFIYVIYFYAKKCQKHKHVEDAFSVKELHLTHQSNAIKFIQNFYFYIENTSELLENKCYVTDFIKDSLIITGTASKSKFFDEYLRIFGFVYKEKLISIYDLPLYDYNLSSSVAIEQYKEYILEHTKGRISVNNPKCIEILVKDNIFESSFYIKILEEIDDNIKNILNDNRYKLFCNDFLCNIISLLRVIIDKSTYLSDEIKNTYKMKVLEVERYKRNVIKDMRSYEWQSVKVEIPRDYIQYIEMDIKRDFLKSLVNTLIVKYPDEIKNVINTQGKFPMFAMVNKQEYDIENYQTKSLSSLINTEPKTVIEEYLNDCCSKYLYNPDVNLINGHALKSINLAALVNYDIRSNLTLGMAAFYTAFKNVHTQKDVIEFIEENYVYKSVFKDKLIGKSTYGIVISNIIECERILLNIYNKTFGKSEHYFSFEYIDEVFKYYYVKGNSIDEFENIILNIYFILYADSGLNLRNNYCHGNKAFRKEMTSDIVDIVYSYIGLIICNNLNAKCEVLNYDK